jgi:methylmalonyl-CoA mutase N-terminal domain/subunit
MFDENTLEQCRKLKEQYDQAIEQRYQGKDFSSTTDSSGIPIKPMYTPLDIQGLDFEKDIGIPGVYPYMRSNYPLHYQFQPWINQPVHGYGLPEHTRERMDMLAAAGMEGHFGGRAYNIVCDVPTHFGVDPETCPPTSVLIPTTPTHRAISEKTGLAAPHTKISDGCFMISTSQKQTS